MKRSFSPFDLAVLCLSVAMISALLVPRIVRTRAQSRSIVCTNNLKQLGLGIHNYHSAYKQLPVACGGSEGRQSESSGNHSRLSVLIGVLPFVEQQKLWETISNPYTDEATGAEFPPMGPVPWFDANVYRPWGQVPPVYQCPDDQKPAVVPSSPKVINSLEPVGGAKGLGVITNYVANYGDGIDHVGVNPGRDNQLNMRARASQRGFFRIGQPSKFRDCLDGLSNTIMFSETIASVSPSRQTKIYKDVQDLITDPSGCITASRSGSGAAWEFGRGSRWSDGALPFTSFQTILPPNSPSCTSDFGMDEGVMSASSQHSAGVHVLMADGAVIFIADSINAGDPSSSSVYLKGTGKAAPGSRSPFGLWGALGTRANAETIEEQLNQSASPRSARSSRSVRPTPRPRQDPKQQMSTWTDVTGEIKLTASFVRIIDQETVELKDTQGIIRRVPLNTLSDKDIFRAVTMDLLND